MPDVCLWLGPPSFNWGFSLALTVCELRPIFFVSSRYVYKFDCIPVMIHWIHESKEGDLHASLTFCFWFNILQLNLGRIFHICIWQ